MSEQQNGSGPALDLEHVLEDDAVFLELARRRLEVVRARRDELGDELAVLDDRVKRYTKTIRDLDPDYVRPEGRKRVGEKIRAVPSRVGPERLEMIRVAILRLAEGDKEFRQIDVTRETGLSSAIMANAFRTLREEEGMIRLARNQPGAGGGKFFRLTREALAR